MGKLSYENVDRGIEGNPNIKTLSGFECGVNLSSKHFMKYVRYALANNLYNDLTMRIAESVGKGEVE